MIPDGLEDQEEVDGEESPGGDAEAAEGLAGGRAQLRVVVRVEGDDADEDEERGPHQAQQRVHDEETPAEEVCQEDERGGEGEAEARAHAQEVLDAEVEAVAVVAEGTQQHHRHQDGRD